LFDQVVTITLNGYPDWYLSGIGEEGENLGMLILGLISDCRWAAFSGGSEIFLNTAIQ